MKQGTDIEHKGMDSDTESDSSEPYDEDEDEKEGPSILVVDYSEIEEYAGTAQDIEWMEHTNHIDIKLEQKIYDKLLEKMGHFKWQSSQYVSSCINRK